MSERPSVVETPVGLLRVLSVTDLLLMALFVMSFGLKGLPAIIFSAYAFPNAHLLIGLIVILAAATIFNLLYARLSSIAPKAGGDYIHVSRFLHPALGFASSLNIVFINILWFALSSVLTAYTLVLAVAGIGVALNNAELMTVSRTMLRDPYVIPAFALAMLLIYWLLSNLSIKLWKRLQMVAAIVAVIGILSGVGVLGTVGKETAARAIADTFGRGKATLLQLAYRAGYNPEVIDPLHVLGAASALGLVMLFSFYPVYFGGESSDRRFRSFAAAMVGASLITAVLLAALILPLYSVLGRELPIAVGYLLMKAPSNIFVLLEYYIRMLEYLAFPPAVVVLLTVSMIAWAFMLSLNLSLASSRCIFAWSLDGLAPLKLSYVTRRWNAPFYANLVTLVSAIILLLVVAVNRFLVIALFGSIASLLVSMFLVSLTAVKISLRGGLLPEEAKAGTLILGVVSSILTLLFLGFYLTNPRLGFLHPATVSIFLGIWAAGFIWYLAASWYRRRMGVNLDEILKEVPPG